MPPPLRPLPPVPPLPPPPLLPPLPAAANEGWWRKNLAVILASVIALVATLSSSCVALQATRSESEAARQQSGEQFRRDERKQAYSALLTSITKLEDTEMTVMRPKSLGVPFDQLQKISIEDVQKWQAAENELISAMSAVDLVGSLQIRDQIRVLRNKHSDVLGAYMDVVLRNMETNRDPAKVEEALKKYDDARRETIRPRFDFINIARTDLGIGNF